MGCKSLFFPQRELPPEEDSLGGTKLFLISFAIGITNPAAILTFLFAFSYFGIGDVQNLWEGSSLVAGVFCGTYFWWGTLTALTRWVRRKAGKLQLSTMNRIFGAVLCLFGGIVFLWLLLSHIS